MLLGETALPLHTAGCSWLKPCDWERSCSSSRAGAWAEVASFPGTEQAH